MPARRVYTEEWRSGLTFRMEEDTRRFMEAVFDMPLDFIAAFEADRNNIANALIAGGQVRGLDTARTYATEILGRMIWMKSIKGQEEPTEEPTRETIKYSEPVLIYCCPQCEEVMIYAGSPKRVKCVNLYCSNRQIYEIADLLGIIPMPAES